MTKDEHEQKAQQNERFAAGFSTITDEYLDWAVVVYFCAALHWVQAFFHKHGADYRAHTDRNQAVARDFPSDEADRYLRLYNSSRLARYEWLRFAPSLLRDTQDHQFRPLKAWLLSQL